MNRLENAMLACDAESIMGTVPDWVSALSAVCALCFAGYAYNLWKAELIGQQKYQSIKGVATAVGVLLREIVLFRRPFKEAATDPLVPPDLREHVHNSELAKLLSEEWSRVVAADVALDVKLSEAEFELANVRSVVLPLRAKLLDLQYAVEVLTMPSSQQKDWEADIMRLRNLVYRSSTKDPFEDELRAMTQKIMDDLRKHARS